MSFRVNGRFVADPHTSYEWLRQEGPVCPARFHGGLDAWLVTRYADAKALLNDRRLSKDVTKGLPLFPPGSEGAHSSPLATHMLHSDPPDHTRLRRLVNKAFTPRTVAQLRPRIERIVDRLLDGMSGTVDMIESFALPIPIAVICELLGVPEEDRLEFQGWSHRLAGEGTVEEIAEASDKMGAYLAGMVRAKRERPREDLVSDLIQVSDGGDQLSERELLNMAFLLLVAGFETTANLLGTGVKGLLDNPEQQAALRADPSLLPAAVEEFLRFEAPIHMATLRFTTEPVQVGDVEIPANQIVMISLLSANRDADRYDDPDRLDICRSGDPHLAFGYGIHHCLGAPLARLEGEVAFGRLLARFPVLTPAWAPESLVWKRSTLSRGLSSLPVRIGP